MAVDIMQAFREEPPPQDFVLPGFLAGTPGALISAGGTGKSIWTLQATAAIAASIAGGADLLGLGIESHGRVIYFAAEDPVSEIIRRIHYLGRHLNDDQRQAISDNLIIEPLAGRRLDVMDDAHARRIIEYCGGARLIVFDTLSRVHRLDENSNGDMSALISQLEYFCKETGGAGVLYLHHVSKAAAYGGLGDLQQAARGASALIDNARWCGYLARMSEAEAGKLTERMDRRPVDEGRRGRFVRFGISKQNYGELIIDKWYERVEGGILVPAHLRPTSKGADDQQPHGPARRAGSAQLMAKEYADDDF